MKWLTPAVIFLCGCVASTQHVQDGDLILSDLAFVVAEEHPGNAQAQRIAEKAGRHAQEPAGFDIGGLIGSLLAAIPGGGPAVLAVLLGTLGIASPGLSGRKSKEKTS